MLSAGCAGSPTSCSNHDTGLVQFSSYGRRVDTEDACDSGERVASLVASGRFADVMVTELAVVHSSLNVALFKVRGDGPVMSSELDGQLAERSPGPVAGDEAIDVGRSQPALCRSQTRV